jgi:hypothetical protein
VDLVEAAGKAIDFMYSLWLGDANITLLVTRPQGINYNVMVTAADREIARATNISGETHAIFRVPRDQAYSVTVTSDVTHPFVRKLIVERSTNALQCDVRLAWKYDRRPDDVEMITCHKGAEAETPPVNSFENRIDWLEESLLGWRLALMQTQFETGLTSFNDAAGLAAFTDRPPLPLDLSFGVLQWSFSGCTLQPVLTRMRRAAPDAFRDAFGRGEIFLTNIIGIPCSELHSDQTVEQLRAAFSGTFDMVWKPRFAHLGADPRIQDLQASELRRWLSIAVKGADCFGLHSKRSLAVLFSMAVTTGELSIRRIWARFNAPANADEAARLQIVVSDMKSGGEMTEKIMSRRLPALLGQDDPYHLDLGESRFEPPGEPSACELR